MVVIEQRRYVKCAANARNRTRFGPDTVYSSRGQQYTKYTLIHTNTLHDAQIANDKRRLNAMRIHDGMSLKTFKGWTGQNEMTKLTFNTIQTE